MSAVDRGWPVRGRFGWVVAVVAVASVAGGCRMMGPQAPSSDDGPAYVLDWDLSQGHEVARTDWQEVIPEGGEPVGRFDDIQILTGGVEMRLELPGGEVVEETFKSVRVDRDETHVLYIDGVFDRDFTVDEAMTFAQELGERWDAPVDNFERWHAEMTARERRGEYVDMTANTNGEPMAERGPEPSFRTVRSGDEDRPVNLVLAFFWLADGEEW